MKKFILVCLGFILFSNLNAQDDTCRVLDLREVYMGMNYKKLSEVLDVSNMEFFVNKIDSTVEADIYLDHSDVNSILFKFQLKTWKDSLDGEIPEDAILKYLMVSYNWDVDINDRLLQSLGAPLKETIPEIRQIYDFDKQWICTNEIGLKVIVTLMAKRVVYTTAE